MISNRQCLDLLAAKFDIISDERRSEPLGKDLASSSDLTPAVLDALASICAAQKGEVFAVSAEISGDHIVLRVAGNNGVPLAVKEHLEGVWKRLQDFNPIPNKNNGHNSEHTPPMDPAEFHSEWALCQQIYQFSMNRLYRRLKKHAEKTLKVLKEWDSGDTRRWEGFDETCEVLEAIDKFFKIRSSPPEEFIIYICQLFQDIYERITPAVAAVSDTAVLAFPPWRGLRKILSLHQDMKTLSRITRSPTRRKYLLKELHIICLDKQHLSCSLDLSVSVPDLHDYFFPSTADPDRKSRTIEILNSWTDAALSKFGDNTTTQSPVHAECIMLLELRKLASVDAGNYIGVSKLSCFACHHFFKAFNSVFSPGQPGFRTKGSHGKMYPKWGDPCTLRWAEADETRKAEVHSKLNAALKDSLKQALIEATHSRKTSDSTTATERSDGYTKQPLEIRAHALGEGDFNFS